MGTWTLGPSEYARLLADVEKLNARKSKHGNATALVTVTGQTRTVTRDNGTEHVVIDATITGVAATFNGWEFLAAVDTITGEDGSVSYIVRSARGTSDVSADARAILSPGKCDHCGIAKSNRVYTYLVRNVESGEMMQVGKSCLRDFIGGEVRPVFFSEDEIMAGYGAGSGGRSFSVATVVGYASMVAELEGEFVPSSAHWQTTTSDIISLILYPTPREKADHDIYMDKLVEKFGAGFDVASRGRDIIAELRHGLVADNNYADNLLAALSAEYVDTKHFRLVVSAIGALNRMRDGEKKNAEKVERAKVDTQWFGNVGEKVTITGTVTVHKQWENDYGGITHLIVVTSGENVFKMFSSAAWTDTDVAGEGSVISLSATVKAHDQYGDEKQTVLVRPKLVK